MGASLAVAAYATFSHLPDRPFRLLVHMALTAKDDDKPPRYYGGAKAMTQALGMDPKRATCRQMASRAASLLVDAGAISRVEDTGYRGKRQEYVIHPFGRVTPESTNKPEKAARAKGKGDSTVRERLTPESTKGDCTVNERVTPESPQGLRKEPLRSESEEEISPLTQVSPRARNEQAMKDAANISPLGAKRIVREFMDNGGVLADLLNDAPEGLTRTQRDQWAATKIAKEAS